MWIRTTINISIRCRYSLRFPDDQENLRRQFEVYDALYAWCWLEVAKQEGRCGRGYASRLVGGSSTTGLRCCRHGAVGTFSGQRPFDGLFHFGRNAAGKFQSDWNICAHGGGASFTRK